MKRIFWMLLVNFFYLPYAIVRLFRYAAHPERYPEEERFAFLKSVDDRAVKGGRIRIEASGMELLPKENGFIYYPNHQGMFDVLAIIKVVERPLAVVFKKELKDIPFLKQIIACMGAVSLDREDPRQGMQVILQVAQEVSEGRNYVIFAEGTRSKNGNQMQDMKGGSFKAAQRAKCPIVPVAILDSYKVMDTGSIAPVTVQVHFLKPLYYEEYQKMKTTEIAQIVRERIEAKISEVSGDHVKEKEDE